MENMIPSNRHVANYILIKSTILLWSVTIFVTIFSGSIISKSISLKTDLHDHSNINNLLLKVNVIGSNKHDIKDIAENFVILTAIFLGLNILICFVWTAIANLTKIFWIHAAFLCFVSVVFLILTILTSIANKRLYEYRFTPEENDWRKLYKGMKNSLYENFSNDNISTDNEVSNMWNSIFIEYECCGVERVSGTTNDFDNSPWCTTAGTCQATVSQIPRTCCKGFTEFDYQMASSTCHSSVNVGEYHEKGCFSVIKKAILKERNLLNRTISGLLTEALTVDSVMGCCSFFSVGGVFVFIVLARGKKQKETEEHYYSNYSMPENAK